MILTKGLGITQLRTLHFSHGCFLQGLDLVIFMSRIFILIIGAIHVVSDKSRLT